MHTARSRPVEREKGGARAPPFFAGLPLPASSEASRYFGTQAGVKPYFSVNFPLFVVIQNQQSVVFAFPAW